MLVQASQGAFEVMCAVEAPEAILVGFGESQERLNMLIRNRATLNATVDAGAEVRRALALLV